MANLEALRQQVFGLYEQQRYEEALELARRAVEDFPASASYWTACLMAVTGREEDALAALDDGLNRGAWWPTLMLDRDPDLESIRDSEAFAHVTAEADRRWKQAFASEPEVHIYPPSGEPSGAVLVALHGSPGEPAEVSARHWRAVCGQGALLVVPQSSQPHSPDGGWTWADEDRTSTDLRFAFDRVKAEHEFDPTRFVLAGFSQGGRVAISHALRRTPTRSCGFIAVAPAMRHHPIEELLAGPDARPRGWIVVGQEDAIVDSVTSLHQAAAGHGFSWKLDLVPDLGHDFSEDFDERLLNALDFVTTRT